MPAAMGKAICKMFLMMELSVKSFICSPPPRAALRLDIPRKRLHWHGALCHSAEDFLEGARKCYAAPMSVNSDPPATKFADGDALSRTLSHQLAANLSTAIAARGLASLVVSGGKSPIKLFELLRVETLDWSRVCIALAA